MKDGFDKAKDIAQIVALVAVPIVIGMIGWMIQISMKDKELRRDYMQLAVTVLSNKEASSDLRAWATDVLADSSPTPLPIGARSDLTSGKVQLVACPKPPTPAWAMEPAPNLLPLLDRIITPSGGADRAAGGAG